MLLKRDTLMESSRHLSTKPPCMPQELIILATLKFWPNAAVWPDFSMMLYLPPGNLVQGEYGLGVAHVTLHTSIKSVPDLITSNSIQEKNRPDGWLLETSRSSES